MDFKESTITAWRTSFVEAGRISFRRRTREWGITRSGLVRRLLDLRALQYDAQSPDIQNLMGVLWAHVYT